MKGRDHPSGPACLGASAASCPRPRRSIAYAQASYPTTRRITEFRYVQPRSARNPPTEPNAHTYTSWEPTSAPNTCRATAETPGQRLHRRGKHECQHARQSEEEQRPKNWPDDLDGHPDQGQRSQYGEQHDKRLVPVAIQQAPAGQRERVAIHCGPQLRRGGLRGRALLPRCYLSRHYPQTSFNSPAAKPTRP